MNCHEAMPLLPAYSDGELDPVQSAAIEQHVFGCADCTVRRDELASLRSRIRSEVPYYTAPPALHARVKAALARATDAPPPERPARDRWRWLTAGALAGSAATVFAWFVGSAVLDASRNTFCSGVSIVGSAAFSIASLPSPGAISEGRLRFNQS